MESLCPWCKRKNFVDHSIVNQCKECSNYFALARPFCQTRIKCVCVNFLGSFFLQSHPIPVQIDDDNHFPLFKMHSAESGGRGYSCTDCGAGVWGTNFAHIENTTNWRSGSRPFDGFLVYKILKVDRFITLHGTKRGFLASFIERGFLPPCPEEGRHKSNGYDGEKELRYTTSSLSVAIKHAGRGADRLVLGIEYSGYMAQTNLEVYSRVMNRLLDNLPKEVGGVAYAWEDGFFFRPQAVLDVIGEIPLPS